MVNSLYLYIFADSAICHEDMTIDENITYCETGCGHNLHVDCMKRWVKHKISENKKITCPVYISYIYQLVMSESMGRGCLRSPKETNYRVLPKTGTCSKKGSS